MDKAQVIRNLRQVSPTIAQPMAALTDLPQWIARPQQLRHSADEGKSLSFEVFLRTVLAIKLLQFRLVDEQLVLARPSGHM